MRHTLYRIVAGAMVLLAPAFAAEPAGQPYTYKDRFSVVFPAGWARNPEMLGLSDDEKKVYGAEFLGPASGHFRAGIAVHHYAPGNLVHKTYEKYVKLHSSPPLGVNMDGKSYGPVRDGKAGNYFAKVFECRNFEYYPKRSLKAKKTFFYEKFYVLPVKTGFFVLRYSAPEDIAKANLKHFEAAVASFRALVR